MVTIVHSSRECSQHLLACQKAASTTEAALYDIIEQAFTFRNVPLDNLRAQTYDGASNMRGCYNGLQAILKENIGKHIIYVHCHAYSINLVHCDAASQNML